MPRVKSLSSSTSLEARHRVVAIDAHVATVALIRRMLEHFGHEVHTATDGRTGVDLIKSVEPDVVISNVEIVGLNGYELANEIRHATIGKQPLMIVHTSYSKHAIAERAKAAGFDLYLSKPVSLRELVRAVEFESNSAAYEELRL